MAKKAKNSKQIDTKKTIPILNGSGQTQEIHYLKETVIIPPYEKHNLDLSKINRAELSRIKNIFTEIVKEEKNTEQPPTTPEKPTIPEESTTQEEPIDPAAPINEKEGK